MRYVFVHGLGDDTTAWDQLLADPLFRDADVVKVCVPGFGGTPWGGECLEDVAQAVWADIDEAGTATVVVGHSMGGVIVTLMAERASAAVVGVVNIEGNLTEADCFFSARLAKTRDIARWLEGFAPEQPSRYGGALQKAHPEALQSFARDLVRRSAGNGLLARWRRLSLPKMYLRGTIGFAPETASALSEDDQVVVVDRAAHWVMDDQPATTAAHIRRFSGNAGAACRLG